MFQVFCLFTCFLLAAWAAAAEELNQFSLASQADWAARRGLLLILDNRYDSAPSKLERLRVTIAVGDGSKWHIRSIPGNFQLQKDYQVKASIDGAHVTLFLDGEQREHFPASFAASDQPLSSFGSPEWARRPAEYLVHQKSLTITTEEGTRTFDGPATIDPRRHLFNPGTLQERSMKLSAPMTIEATFQIVAAPDLKALSPLVDRYGQVNFAIWEGKVTSDEQLKAAIAEEDARLDEWEKTLPPQDKFGGRTDLGWKDEATGFFRVVKRGGKWWLISPEGNPCFFTGISNVPADNWEATPVTGREYIFESLPPSNGVARAAWGHEYWGDAGIRYFAPQAVNLMIQFGDDWRKAETDRAIRRARAWGFSGMGKWTNMPQQTRLPVLSRKGVINLVRHPDTFDPEIRKQFREVLERQLVNLKDDPWIIGFSLGNEMDECFTADEVRTILRMGDGSSHAKRAMVDFAIAKLFDGDAAELAREWKAIGTTAAELYNLRLTPRQRDIEPLRMLLAEDYFSFVYRTVKELAPNHLYFGHWILPTYWHNENDWRHIAPHCDVIGFDLYEDDFNQQRLQELIRESNKPVFCGEFGFPPHWDGERGFGRFRTGVADEQEAGKRYARWVKAAAENPWCVGVSVFQYRDQPVTGRGPVAGASPAAVHGENYAFGMVDITNRPRWSLLEHVRSANIQAAVWRNSR